MPSPFSGLIRAASRAGRTANPARRGYSDLSEQIAREHPDVFSAPGAKQLSQEEQAMALVEALRGSRPKGLDVIEEMVGSDSRREAAKKFIPSLSATGLGSMIGANSGSAEAGTIEGPKYDRIVKLAELIDSIDSDQDLAGGVTSYLRKFGYGDKVGMGDRARAFLDFL
jgi:hypothetical protein